MPKASKASSPASPPASAPIWPSRRADAHEIVAGHLARAISRALDTLPKRNRAELVRDAATRILDRLGELERAPRRKDQALAETAVMLFLEMDSAIVGTTPRTHVLFSFQSAGSSTLLTVDLAAWIAGLGTVELARPVAADLLVQALSRLKFSIENSDPIPNTYSIFVNYRRRAIRYASGRIYAALVAEFGQGAVFRDIASLKGGTLFPVDLEATIQRCPIVIAMIGPTWARDLAARREPDWVRIELEHALKRKKSDTAHVIPLLVGVRQFPATEVKGTELEALGDWNAMRVRPDPDFRADMQRLIDRIWEILPPTSLPDAVRRDGPGGPAPRQGIAPEYP